MVNIRRLKLTLLILVRLLGLVSADLPITQSSGSAKEVLVNSNVQFVKTEDELVALLNRDDVCTLLLVGAFWDGHLGATLRNPRVQDFLKTVSSSKSAEVAFLEYGYHTSEGTLARLPGALEPYFRDRSPGSYEMKVFQSGKLLSAPQDILRDCWSSSDFEFCMLQWCKKKHDTDHSTTREL